MKHFDLFSGYGGFTLALQKVYGDNRNTNVSQERGGEKTSQGDEQEVGERLHPVSSETTLSSATNSDKHPNGSINERQFNVIQTIGFSEIDKYASAVLKYHWPNTKNYGDITKINWAEVPDFDLLTGGSPCQDLSIAGKRAGLDGARSGLFHEYMRAVKEKKPKYFIWENVKGALSSSQGFDFSIVINEMAEAGYSLWWQVLNAKDFGVPQNRERIFVIGFRDRPAPEIFFERGATGNSIKVVGELNSETWQKRNESIRRVHSADGVAPTTPTGTGGGVMTKIVQPVLTPDRENKRQNGRRFKEDGEPSFTVNTQDRHGVYDGAKIRRLTPLECERLMGLPDGWTSKGVMNDQVIDISDSQRYKLCGNGVVVNVVEEIIKHLII